MSKFHSVHLNEDKCEGCTSCVQNCPTRAIRVHQGQAWIKEKKCIDCGECIRSCEHHAKEVVTDEVEEIEEVNYPVALVPPSFYGQFVESVDPRKVVIGLQQLGFKEVWDVALGAEVVTKATQEYLESNSGPVLSSACPTVVRLVEVLYPELVDYLLPIKSPVEAVAQRARLKIEGRGVSKQEIGIYFITPCPAKMTTVKNPLGQKKSWLEGAIAVDKIYRPLLKHVEEITDSEIEDYELPYLGIGWANRGGASKLLEADTISVSGIHNVMEVLEGIDRGDLSHISHFELLACEPGCVGGVLNVKNPFLAQFNIQQLVKQKDKFIEQDFSEYDLSLAEGFEAKSAAALGNNFSSAISKLGELETEKEALPGLDCAACGAPDCDTLAEDIVKGLAQRSDCVFILREQLADLSDQMASLAHAIPPVMQQENEAEEEDNNEN